MAESLQKKHWLVHVLRRAGIGAPADLAIDPGTPSVEAWEAVCETTGLSPDELAVRVGHHFRLKVADLGAAEAGARKLVPEKIARRHSIFPLREDDRHLTVATGDPTDFVAEQTLGFLSGRKAVFEVAPPSSIVDSINAMYGPEGVNGKRARRESPDQSSSGGRRPYAEDGSLGQGEPPDEAPILVVDDDPEDRLLVRTVLTKSGYEVQEAAAGHEALEMIGEGRSHALVVLDLEMPIMDGREVLASLRRSGPTAALPVVVLTGSPDPEDEYRLMEGGADDYLPKPLDPPRFVARIEAALRRARIV